MTLCMMKLCALNEHKQNKIYVKQTTDNNTALLQIFALIKILLSLVQR